MKQQRKTFERLCILYIKTNGKLRSMFFSILLMLERNYPGSTDWIILVKVKDAHCSYLLLVDSFFSEADEAYEVGK